MSSICAYSKCAVASSYTWLLSVPSSATVCPARVAEVLTRFTTPDISPGVGVVGVVVLPNIAYSRSSSTASSSSVSSCHVFSATPVSVSS